VPLVAQSASDYNEHADRAKDEFFAARRDAEEFERMLELKLNVSAVIGGDDESPVIQVGTLRDVRVREATPDEMAESDSLDPI
jgi:hypothetical protein